MGAGDRPRGAVVTGSWPELVRRYYDACSAGDLRGLHATLHAEVVHWFLAPNVGSAPVRGREHLARYWRKVQAMTEARWIGPIRGGAAGRSRSHRTAWRGARSARSRRRRSR
ncbi:nuclear transport factor 2 family protein [Pseudonocardia kujensis]|uniref:nuclear transport factor 2 family protein n=1 Tax=Pseudonocardia kujensis TaxID=1128675 RepID=UPI0035582AF7